MRIHPSAPRPTGYFIRSSPDGPERGPLTLENLRDLAEFQHVTPNSEIRSEQDETWRELHEIPDLLTALFPEKTRFAFKSYQRSDNSDAERAPVDVRNLYRCEKAEVSPGQVEAPPPAQMGTPDHPASTESPPAEGLPAESGPADSGGFDPRQMLAESVAIAKARASAHQPDPGHAPKRFRTRRTLFLVRWLAAALFMAMVWWLWTSLAASPFWAILLSLPLLAFAIALIVSDILDWALDGFQMLSTREPSPPVDYTKAEQLFRAEKWKAAAAAYGEILNIDPHQIRAYREGIAAAIAAGEKKKLKTFQDLAVKHLGSHDRNLLDGALRRHGLPPLPAHPGKPAAKA